MFSAAATCVSGGTRIGSSVMPASASQSATMTLFRTPME